MKNNPLIRLVIISVAQSLVAPSYVFDLLVSVTAEATSLSESESKDRTEWTDLVQ